MNARETANARPLRCAIYTRKSVREGLERDYNTLESQRDLCSAYIRSQRHRNWIESPVHYADGGYSGGNLERPALGRLCNDIETGQIDVVILYKIDRLTRSLGDFVRLIEFFDRFGVAFVSVTQTFDTNESMGRLVLNILLTFAQFEREMASDRIRDKIGAMRRSGRWSGGRPPIGYDLVQGALIVNPDEADIVREIYALYVKLGSAKKVARALAHTEHRSKSWVGKDGKQRGGRKLSATMIYYVVGRRLYLGEIESGGEVFPGRHEPIVDRETFERASEIRGRNAMPPRMAVATRKNLLVGLIFDEHGRRMVIDSRARETALYRYYASNQPKSERKARIPRTRVSATGIEKMVLVGICNLLRDRFSLSGALLDGGAYDAGIERQMEGGAVAARRLECLEHPRLRLVFEQLIARIEVTKTVVRVILSTNALASLLDWDGHGLFRAATRTATKSAIHLLELEAQAVRTERAFSLPIEPRAKDQVYRPDPKLVGLLMLAQAVQAKIDANRHLSVAEIAPMFNRRPASLARILRLNYLAPDIRTAILDGRQPKGLVRNDLLYAALPMEWSQQRALLGFPPQGEVMNAPANHQVRYFDEPGPGDPVEPSLRGADRATAAARRGASRGWVYPPAAIEARHEADETPVCD